MNQLIVDLLSIDVGVTAQDISDLSGLSLGTVQGELDTALVANAITLSGGEYFLGPSAVAGPVADIQVDLDVAESDIDAVEIVAAAATTVNVAQDARLAVLEAVTHQKTRNVIHTSCRWYARSGRWYGPNDTYGPSYYNWNTSHGSSGLPDYEASGFTMPYDVTLRKIGFWGAYNNSSNTYTMRLIRHVKTDNSQTVVNTQIGQDLVVVDPSSSRPYYEEFNLNSNLDLDAGDIIVPIAQGTDSDTRYIYVSGMFIEYIER